MTAAPSTSIAPYAVWSGLDHLSVPDAIDFVVRAEEAGYGAFWTREGFGRDPFSLLARLAPAVRSMVLGTSIANIYARDPAAMRAAASTVHEMLDGRFVLGLGVSHAPWVSGIRGHDYGSPVATMRAYLSAYRDAPYRGSTPFGEPSIVLAALRQGMIRLAGAEADGAFPYLMPGSAVPELRRDLDDAAGAAGRPRPSLIVAQVVLIEDDAARARTTGATYLRNYLALPAYVASLTARGYDTSALGDPPSPAVIDDLVLWGSPDAIRDRLRAVLDVGADQVAVVPLAADGTVGSATTFEAVAPRADP
jgi:probable F420-dependent oxidoreductase